MKSGLRGNKDFLAGVLLLAFGVAAMAVARNYPMGSAMRMGPGYFPTLLAGILVLFGITLIFRGVLSGEKVKGEWAWKPVALLTLSMVLFGFIVTRLGLVPALAMMFIVSALAGHAFRLKEVLLLTLVMSTFAIAVFAFLLKMPFQLFAGL